MTSLTHSAWDKNLDTSCFQGRINVKKTTCEHKVHVFCVKGISLIVEILNDAVGIQLQPHHLALTALS